MYAPPAFRLDDENVALALIAEISFGAFVTINDGAPIVSHLPFILSDDKTRLRGHLARANPHSLLFDGRRHLAVFTGANGYISPNWYGARDQVPTWNYLAVHVEGVALRLDAERAVDELLADLSCEHERRRHDLNRDQEWTMDKLDGPKLAKLRAAIVAFEMQIETLEAKAKLSQNKPAEDVLGVLRALDAGDQNQRALAQAMRGAKGDD